jgi:hypothetical protein
VSDDVVDRAKAALENVTPPPWRTEAGDQADDAIVFTDTGPSLFFCPDCGTNAETGGREATFVAASRQLVPELIAEVERLREVDAQLDAIKDVADSYRLIEDTQILEILHPVDKS